MKLLRGGRRVVGRAEPGKGKGKELGNGRGGVGERIWSLLWMEKGVGGGGKSKKWSIQHLLSGK